MQFLVQHFTWQYKKVKAEPIYLSAEELSEIFISYNKIS